jgi:hypothetical protein
MPQYTYRSAHELARLIRDGQATSVDIVKEHVDRVKECNGALNAVVALFEAEALATAAERDRQTRDGGFLGPLPDSGQHPVPHALPPRGRYRDVPRRLRHRVRLDSRTRIEVRRRRRAAAVRAANLSSSLDSGESG